MTPTFPTRRPSGLDDQDTLARADIEPRGQRQLVAVIARQINRDQPLIVSGEILHRSPASVARAVVDQHYLIGIARPRACRRASPPVQLWQASLLGIAGAHDGTCKGSHTLTSRTEPGGRRTNTAKSSTIPPSN